MSGAEPLPNRVDRTELARAVWGIALVAAPQQVLRGIHHSPVDRPSVQVLRVLGVRHLLQAGAVSMGRTPRVLLLASVVDVSHWLTAVALAVFGGPYARAGAVETAVAGAWSVAEARRAVRAFGRQGQSAEIAH